MSPGNLLKAKPQPQERIPPLYSRYRRHRCDFADRAHHIIQKIHQVELQTLRPFRVGTLHPGFRHCSGLRQHPGCKQDPGLDNILGIGNMLHSVQLGVYKLYWM